MGFQATEKLRICKDAKTRGLASARASRNHYNYSIEEIILQANVNPVLSELPDDSDQLQMRPNAIENVTCTKYFKRFWDDIFTLRNLSVVNYFRVK